MRSRPLLAVALPWVASVVPPPTFSPAEPAPAVTTESGKHSPRPSTPDTAPGCADNVRRSASARSCPAWHAGHQ